MNRRLTNKQIKSFLNVWLENKTNKLFDVSINWDNTICIQVRK